MVICPNCQFKEITGAIFCSNCGSQIADLNLATQKIVSAERQAAEKITSDLHPSPNAPLQSWLSLHILETGQILPLADRLEFTLGRMAEGQPIIPDIDLSPYKAYDKGVSRLHSAIKLVNNQVVIIDLGSANGTFLNGIRLSPYVEMPVADGDIVLLGKLKLQLLIST